MTTSKSFEISFHIVGPRKDVWRCSLSVQARRILYVHLEICLVYLILVVAQNVETVYDIIW